MSSPFARVANGDLHLVSQRATDALAGFQCRQLGASGGIRLLIEREQFTVDGQIFNVQRIAAHRVVCARIVERDARPVGVQYQGLIVVGEIVT